RQGAENLSYLIPSWWKAQKEIRARARITSFFLCASSRKTVFTRKRAKFPFFSLTTPPGSAPDLFHRPPSFPGKNAEGVRVSMSVQQAVALACCVQTEPQVESTGAC
ncbi:hypothetical protein, partial [uncultured Ruegeria sp.]|uniref:hypothetical protein n=1 Tax=uncultured Ruegeria sp. TaxID=259304 RepID=UPI00261E98E2